MTTGSTVMGKCSICGGQVTVPCVWFGTIPPIPTCEKCGAVAKVEGPTIPMDPPPKLPTDFFCNDSD